MIKIEVAKLDHSNKSIRIFAKSKETNVQSLFGTININNETKIWFKTDNTNDIIGLLTLKDLKFICDQLKNEKNFKIIGHLNESFNIPGVLTAPKNHPITENENNYIITVGNIDFPFSKTSKLTKLIDKI